MDWSKGLTASIYLSEIDPLTFRDIRRIEMTGGTITRTSDGLKESASVDVIEQTEKTEQWVRIYLDAKQDGEASHTAIFTGLATSPSVSIDGIRRSRTLECYSVLKPCQDIMLVRGWYAPAGSSGAEMIKELLSAGFAPIITAENSPHLKDHIVAEDDETNLTMIEKILTAIDWRIRISGDGTIHIEPKPITPVLEIDPESLDILEPEITVTEDLFDAPNVLMAVQDDLIAIAKDEEEIESRGREVWEKESATLSKDETLEAYTLRRLKELQKAERTASYSRRFVPEITTGDILSLHYPEQGLDGLFEVESQSIDLTSFARTNEEVKELR